MATAEVILERKGRDVVTVNKDATVLQVAQTMNEKRIGSVIVVDDGLVQGIFTERDILTRVVAAQKDPAATPVGEVMTTPTAC